MPSSLHAFSQRTAGYLLLLYPATAAWTVLWAGYDIMIAGRAFPVAAGNPANLHLYWTATWWVLFPITTLLAFRRHAWLPILAVLVGGWEDVLFYWIQGVPVPQDVSYLVPTPTDTLLYLRAALFLGVSIVGAILARHPGVRIRHLPLPLVMLAAGFLFGFWPFVAVIPIYVAARLLLRYLEGRRIRGVRL